jgi:hypothetical protein
MKILTQRCIMRAMNGGIEQRPPFGIQDDGRDADGHKAVQRVLKAVLTGAQLGAPFDAQKRVPQPLIGWQSIIPKICSDFLTSDLQRSFSADPVILLPWPKPLKRRACCEHIAIGVSPADDLHPGRQAVG